MVTLGKPEPISDVAPLFKQLIVDRGWPETWEAKLGEMFYTVEASKSDGWYVGWSRRQNDPECVIRTVKFDSRSAAMQFCGEHSQLWGS